MPPVPPTSLTTTQPGHGALTLCDGFAMFPWLGTIRARTDIDDSGGIFFEKTYNFEIFRFGASATHTAFVGVCGPSYATDIDVVAGTGYQIPSPGQPAAATMVVGDHAIRGGFQCGMDWGIDIGVELTANFVVTKKRLLAIDGGIDFDLIELLFDLLKLMFASGGAGKGEGEGEKSLEPSKFADTDSDTPQVEENQRSGNPHGAKGEWTGAGSVDYIPKPWLPPPDRTHTVAPKATLEPNIAYAISIVPLFAEIPGLDLLYALDEALEKVGGGFELGPGFTIGLPTTVTLKGATISNHPFDVVSVTASGSDPDATTTLGLAERTPVDPHLQPLGQDPDEIGALLEHEVGFQLGLYFFAEISFLKVFHLGFQTGTIDLIEVDRLPDGAGGPFENQLSFVPGGGPVPFGPPVAAPTVGAYTANQPQGRWQGGVLASYGVSFFDQVYESPIGPFSAYDPLKRFFAFPQLSGIPTGAGSGRNIYRLFNDGSPVELVGTIADNTTTTFTDTKP
jgi:hypothetical protein